MIHKKPKGRVAVVRGSLYSERRADGKSLVSLAVLMLTRLGQKKRLKGFSTIEPKSNALLFHQGNFSRRADNALNAPMKKEPSSGALLEGLEGRETDAV